MNTDIYHFKVGDFECIAISDGTYIYKPPLIPPPATILFSNAPKILLDQTLVVNGIQPDGWLTFIDPFICLMVNTGRHKVLVDTGAGDLTPNTGKLLRNLQTVGVGPGDVDTVILTHGHEDHVGGNTNAQGKPTFTKARYVMWKEEWTYWTSDEAERLVGNSILTFIRKNLLPIQDQMDLVGHEVEIVPGVLVVPSPGHTPGHVAVVISSKGEQLFYVSDAFIHPIHTEHPEWYTTFDMAPGRLIKTRHLLLNKIITEKALLVASHFPFPGIGHVVQRGDERQWQPIETIH